MQVTNDEGRVLALKLHRLGRTSFRNVRVNIVRIVLCSYGGHSLLDSTGEEDTRLLAQPHGELQLAAPVTFVSLEGVCLHESTPHTRLPCS